MLQDLPFGRLENEFKNLHPEREDIVVCFRNNDVLLKRDEFDALTLPTVAQVGEWAYANSWEHWNEEAFQYVFRMQDVNYFIWMGEAGEPGDPAFAYESAKAVRQRNSKHICFAELTAWHLFSWYRASRFCGRCGTATVHDGKERMMRCPNCGNMIFPRISPSVIVGVIDGDRLLLSKYANRANARYALIAGFTEIGETGEQTVEREVMEEVGLKVKNVRYYKTQPWGVDGNLLLGYYCDLDGSDQIELDRSELAMADWFHRSELPEDDDGISLTREMIQVFKDGREPK